MFIRCHLFPKKHNKFVMLTFKLTITFRRSFFRPSDGDVPGEKINPNGQVVFNKIEEQAYNQANTKEPIQVIDMGGWRSSVGHHDNLEEWFDWTEKQKERYGKIMFSNELSTLNRSDEHEVTKKKMRLWLPSSENGVEIKRKHKSRYSPDNLGQTRTSYKTGQISQQVKDQSYPFTNRRSRVHSPNRSFSDYMAAKLDMYNTKDDKNIPTPINNDIYSTRASDQVHQGVLGHYEEEFNEDEILGSENVDHSDWPQESDYEKLLRETKETINQQILKDTLSKATSPIVEKTCNENNKPLQWNFAATNLKRTTGIPR